MDYVQLSRVISHALRHAPQDYGLILDESGWVPIDALLAALKSRPEFSSVVVDDLHKIISSSDKKRHEICGGRVRAVYGHSLPDKIAMTPSQPPAYLYHGTPRLFLENIFKVGLIAKSRQYVHMSIDRQTAETVGQRRDQAPMVLTVLAAAAFKTGHKFYQAPGGIWLADAVPAVFIEPVESETN